MKDNSIHGIQVAEAGDIGRFIEVLKSIVGRKYVLTRERAMRRFCTGFRFGTGQALAVVRPGTLRELWQVAQTCVSADKIVIMQAANTGLTGGSTPDADDYDRAVILISTMRMRKLHVIEDGKQVICFPGATLDQLEQALRPLGREPHSVIGSSCIGASVLGGVCNNSGGSLVQRGPAYTEMSLFARVNAAGELELVNHLEIRLEGSPEEMLERLEHRRFSESDIESTDRRGHDEDYIQHVRDISANTPSRFNADQRCLYEASGCAGKLIVFAVRLDTFPAPADLTDFYIGTSDVNELTLIRREILANFPVLPVSAEYLHRDAFNVAELYGKDTFLLIQFLGTRRLPLLFALRNRLQSVFSRPSFLPSHLTDRLMHRLGAVFPPHLPPRIREFRDRFEHHLMLRVAGPAVAASRTLLQRLFPSPAGDYFECTPIEGKKAFLHRFCVAGAAIRYRALHDREVEEIVALDIALRRNDTEWFETLPRELERRILLKLYYGHFLCHVFHRDYLVRKGHDPVELEHCMRRLLDERGAKYPAEHNVGHLYEADPSLRTFYESLDPRNVLNSGIGKLSKLRSWTDPP